MSLLSPLVPLLSVYYAGLAVILHQLRRRLRSRCPPAPGEHRARRCRGRGAGQRRRPRGKLRRRFPPRGGRLRPPDGATATLGAPLARRRPGPAPRSSLAGRRAPGWGGCGPSRPPAPTAPPSPPPPAPPLRPERGTRPPRTRGGAGCRARGGRLLAWLHAGLSAASQAVWGVRGYFASPLFFFLPLLALGRSATDLRSGDRRGGAPSGPGRCSEGGLRRGSSLTPCPPQCLVARPAPRSLPL